VDRCSRLRLSGESGGESVDAEVEGLVEITAELERTGELHADEAVRPCNDRSRGLERMVRAGKGGGRAEHRLVRRGEY
jgi:hypothetical protein